MRTKKARTLDASGQERLFLARLVHGLRDVPHLFDPTLRVGFSHDEVIQFAVKGLANEVEIIQADSLCKIVVQLIRLSPRRVDSKILIIAFCLLLPKF